MQILSYILLYLIIGLIAYPIFLISSMEGKIKKYSSEWDGAPLYIVRALFFSITWPFLMILLFLNFIVNRKDGEKLAVRKMKDFIVNPKKDDGNLKYSRMGGKGIVHCNECGHSEKVHSFTHFMDISDTSGYQCQACGQFTTRSGKRGEAQNMNCDCGGELSRDEVIFCPLCKSENVRYNMTLIT